MAKIARSTHIPIATGERVFTKWGFPEVLQKRAAIVLQPDLCHAGMAEAFYAAFAPHNPLGPISLAAGVQLAASIPNFLCQEQASLGVGYLKKPFDTMNGHVRSPRRRDWALNWTGTPWPTKSATIGRIRRATTTTAQSSIGRVGRHI